VLLRLTTAKEKGGEGKRGRENSATSTCAASRALQLLTRLALGGNGRGGGTLAKLRSAVALGRPARFGSSAARSKKGRNEVARDLTRYGVPTSSFIWEAGKRRGKEAHEGGSLVRLLVFSLTFPAYRAAGKKKEEEERGKAQLGD